MLALPPAAIEEQRFSPQNRGEQLARDRDLCHLKRDVSAVADDLGTNEVQLRLRRMASDVEVEPPLRGRRHANSGRSVVTSLP
jgi:hypothetical protein